MKLDDMQSSLDYVNGILKHNLIESQWRCRHCIGTGEIVIAAFISGGGTPFKSECSHCRGSGIESDKKFHADMIIDILSKVRMSLESYNDGHNEA